MTADSSAGRSAISAVIDRRYRCRRHDAIIQCLGLEAPSVALRTGRVSAIAAEQNADMHFVGLALEPFEKSADAVPAIVLRQLLHVGVLVARLAVDDEILVGLRQILERNAGIDLLPHAGPHQVALRIAHLLAAENADRALRDRERAVGDRLVQIDRNRSSKAAALRAGAEWIIETEETRRRRANIEIAMGAVPAGGERHFGFRISDFGFRNGDDIDLVLAETKGGFDGFDQTGPV